MRRAIAALVTVSLVGCAAAPAPPPASLPPMRLAQATPASATPPPPGPESREMPNEGQQHPLAGANTSRSARNFGWISIAAGSVAGVVAIGTSFLILHDKNVRDSECDANKVCSQAGIDANDAIQKQVWWNTGAYAVAAIGLGVGAFLVLTNPPPKEAGEPDERKSEAKGSAQLGIGPTGVSLRGSF